MNKEPKTDSLKNQSENFNENFTQEKEQIIIDGVDVSECKHYEKHTFYDCNETCEDNGAIVCTNCKYNPNCYFKQLARKTQECEKYKKLAADFKDVNKQLGYKYLTIKDECEGLTRKVDEYKKALNEIEEICRQLLDDDYIRSVAESLIDIISKAKGEENVK